jgi:prolipoprotein diacylglyceryltransferase
VEPVPTSFQLGPFTFHTYGFGLAIAAYVAYRYAARRFSQRGISTEHFGAFTGWVLLAALIGARLAHVATNWSLYSGHPADALALWQGGLSSFGALALAIPVGYGLHRHWWPEVSRLAFTDALVPALVLGWAIGRFLGPQFMYAGGGHVTDQWFGMRYAGQVGRRVPVPIIQGIEDGLLWLGLLWLEKRPVARASGVITGVALVIWGIVRSFDERYLLGQEGHSGSVGVQISGLVLAAVGIAILVSVRVTEPDKTSVAN